MRHFLFKVTAVTVFLAIVFEFLMLYFQLKRQLLTNMFHEKAFNIYKITVIFLWVIIGCMFLYLQTTKHVRFCCCDFIKYSGIIPIVAGAVLSTWAFLILGTDRSSQVNFFVENVPVVKRSVYKYLKNPQYLGLWLMLAGVTLFTESVYNLVITVEFILLMAPLAWLENRMLQKNKT